MSIPALFYTSAVFFVIATIVIYGVFRSPLMPYFLDEPDKRKMHQLQIPRIGGFGILFSYGIAMLLFWLVAPEIFSLILWNPTGKAIGFAALLVFILGFFDDSTFVELNVPIKLGVQILIALGVVYYFDINFEELYILDKMIPLGEVGKVLTVFWIVGVTNALNIIDGIDGLSASVTVSSLGIAAIVLFITGHTEPIFVLVPLIAVILGFLVHNYPPARLFAGDTGSLFFGSIIAIFSVRIASLGIHGVESLSGFYVAAFPVIEVLVSIIRRFVYARRGDKGVKDSIKQVVTPDNLHMHHRLIFKGFSHEQALRFLIFLAVSVSSISIILVMTDVVLHKVIAILYSIVFLVMVLRRLDYGKQNYLMSEQGELVRRVIAITGESDYFEHSLRHYARSKYWIARFERVSDIMGRRVDAFVVYNDNEDRIDIDIQRALDVKAFSDRPIFFISDVAIDKMPELKQKNCYVIRKPVDMPYLMHDIEKVIAFGSAVSLSDIKTTLTIEE